MASSFSFGDSLKNVQIPVVSLNNNGIKWNFIVDTGSSSSAVNLSSLPGMLYEPLEDKNSSIGIEGKEKVCDTCGITFTDDCGNQFVDVMTVVDMDDAFRYIKESDGVELHGILGSTFFSAYGCVLDYRKQMIYIE